MTNPSFTIARIGYASTYWGNLKDSAMSKHILFIAALGALAACSGTAGYQGDATVTKFFDPNSDGTFSIDFAQSSRKQYKDADGDGYAFMGGAIQNEGFLAVAGVLPQTTVDTPVSAKVNYTGRYNMISIEEITLYDSGYIYGLPNERTGALTGTADFSAKTFNASSQNGLSLSGSISGTNVSGTMTYKDTVSGEFKALAGQDKAIGAFHGKSSNSDQMVAGGFNIVAN